MNETFVPIQHKYKEMLRKWLLTSGASSSQDSDAKKRARPAEQDDTSLAAEKPKRAKPSTANDKDTAENTDGNGSSSSSASLEDKAMGKSWKARLEAEFTKAYFVKASTACISAHVTAHCS